MLLIVRGLPGSGKSTFAHQYFPDWFHVEQDQFFMSNGEYSYRPGARKYAVEWCSDMVRKAINHRMDVILTTCCVTEKAVNWYRKIAQESGVESEVILCCGNYGTTHNVPQDALDSMKADWEWYPGEIPACDYIKWKGLKKKYARVSSPLKTKFK